MNDPPDPRNHPPRAEHGAQMPPGQGESASPAKGESPSPAKGESPSPGEGVPSLAPSPPAQRSSLVAGEDERMQGLSEEAVETAAPSDDVGAAEFAAFIADFKEFNARPDVVDVDQLVAEMGEDEYPEDITILQELIEQARARRSGSLRRSPSPRQSASPGASASETTTLLQKRRVDQEHAAAPGPRQGFYDRPSIQTPDLEASLSSQVVPPAVNTSATSSARAADPSSRAFSLESDAPPASWSFMDDDMDLYEGPGSGLSEHRNPRSDEAAGYYATPLQVQSASQLSVTPPTQIASQSQSEPTIAPKKGGRPRKPPPRPVEAAVELPYFVRDSSNQTWVLPDDLDEETTQAMSGHIHAMVTGKLFVDRYRAMCKRGDDEIAHAAHSCTACQVVERNRNLCENSPASVDACSKCCNAGKQPCGKLIKHPHDSSKLAIGFHPLPADQRIDVLWPALAYWVRPRSVAKK